MNPWWILALVVAFAAGAVAGEWDGARRVDLRWTAKVSKERADGESAARQQESMWQGVVNGTVKNYEGRIAAIRRDRDAGLHGLRDRPGRAVGLSANAGTGCQGGTGAGLSREDAEFLVGEASRADKLRAALEACYAVLDGVSRD